MLCERVKATQTNSHTHKLNDDNDIHLNYHCFCCYVRTLFSFIKMRHNNHSHLHTHIASASTRTELCRDFNEWDEFFVWMFIFSFYNFDQNKTNAIYLAVAEVINEIYLRSRTSHHQRELPPHG